MAQQFAARLARALAVGTTVAMVAACGGGGSSASTPTPVSAAVTYPSSALAGELVDFTVNLQLLTYAYTITESQFGLTGHAGSGTLVRNADGTYQLSGIPGAVMAILPNGLLLGAIRDTFGGVMTTVPILGMQQPVSTLSSAASTYDFVQRSCISGVCSSGQGTFQLNADGTWTSCAGGDLSSATPACTVQSSGTVNSLGNGKWQVMQAGTDIGTAFAFNSSGQNVMIMDLKDSRAGGFGIGLLVGSSEQAISPSLTDGTWLAAGTDASWLTFAASGNAINYLTFNGAPASLSMTMTMNSPWAGFVAPSVGGAAMLAGAGVYVYEYGGYGEIGLKIH